MTHFSQYFATLAIQDSVQQAQDTSKKNIQRILAHGRPQNLADFAALISPEASDYLEPLAQHSRRITQQHFGKTIRLFAPLYLSNECINICRYCGFSRNNPIPRHTVPVDQVRTEAQKLAQQGFRSLLLVAGEHPKHVSNGYVANCIRECLPYAPSIQVELAPMETPDYEPLVEAGGEGVVVYQETYHEATYRTLHTAGPKKNYTWRLDAPERAYAAGFRRLGIGALFGLHDWRTEALALAAHARYLLKMCWKAQLSLSLLRLRPAAGEFAPDLQFQLSDRHLIQLICALRLFLPSAGITLSTREAPELRDRLVPIGVTTLSAGSCTQPGGYSAYDQEEWRPPSKQPGEQFQIADERPPQTVADMIHRQGYDPVWKDFDQTLASP